MKKIKFGLYGTNGHQIHHLLAVHPGAEFYAAAEFDRSKVPQGLNPKFYESLDELLKDPEIDAVCLCSPLRSSQAQDAVKCLKAGKHVYAEKPSALAEKDLNMIIEASKQSGKSYHEMAGTAFEAPYAAVRKLVRGKVIGDIIQIYSQKSYPWGDWRPGDENIDGGLAMQAGIYNCRFVEHVAGEKISSIIMRETRKGNRIPDSKCRRAVSFLMELESGALSSAIANYCCPKQPSWNKWGYETLIIFGDRGFIECANFGETARIVINGKKIQNFDCSEGENFLNMFIEEISGGKKIPFSLEEELSPTRWVIRAKKTASDANFANR